MGFLWIVLVGFVAGMIARWLSPGPNNPTGFILTTVVGIAGAFLATFIGQAIGWYRADQGAGFIGDRRRVLVLFIWNRLVARGDKRPATAAASRAFPAVTGSAVACAAVSRRISAWSCSAVLAPPNT